MKLDMLDQYDYILLTILCIIGLTIAQLKLLSLILCPLFFVKFILLIVISVLVILGLWQAFKTK